VTRRLLSALLATALFAAGVSAQAGQPDADAIVTRAARNFRALTSLQADFRQRIEDPFLGPTNQRGVMSQSGTSRFAMRFTEPANEAIVLDGTNTWIYTPSTVAGMVRRSPMPSGPTYGLNLLAWFLDRPLERYRVSYVKTEEIDGRRCDVLLLEAVAADLPFRRATVWFDREDALPRRLEIQERPIRRIIELTRLRPNIALAPGVFTFTVPNGVRVIDQKS